ncbi:MAG: cytidylate kinase-like family protein [Chloroflexota bacterium]|nr:cytidylate kinase-like family protein [Chloroflexota bacterium]
MGVITVSRELGSKGTEIAHMVAERMGYECVDRELIADIAREAGVEEAHVSGKEESISARPRIVGPEMAAFFRRQRYASRQPREALEDQAYVELVRKVICDRAEGGNVVVLGRGGQMVLQDWSGALHVHIAAPLKVRVERIAEEREISLQLAERLVRQSDRRKRSYIRHFYDNADWRNPRYYHLILDTDRIPPEVAAEIIIRAAQVAD